MTWMRIAASGLLVTGLAPAAFGQEPPPSFAAEPPGAGTVEREVSLGKESLL